MMQLVELRSAQVRPQPLDLALIKNLPSGSFVRVCAEIGNTQGDRFWVRLTDTQGSEWTGEIWDSPVFLNFKPGDRLRLRPENVYDFRYPDDSPIPK